tara:strand:+ start:48133 stop:50454 length:2322 start_codon:yes stop_codon:yes gene_type:complete
MQLLLENGSLIIIRNYNFMKMRILSLLFLSVLFSSISFGQIIIDDTPTPTSLVTNTLIGPGLVTSNITFTGASSQIGFFDANGSNIGLDSGVVMSSGTVVSISPPGNPDTDLGGTGDADVLATAQSVTSNPNAGLINSTFDAAVLEFDFVPTGDVVIFRFVFASEEYLTYVNTQFNDAFGFYISGPNPAGGNYNVQNLALVPGTTEPITISTIHPGLNPQYYIGTPVGHQYNGFTVPIEIRFDVICDSTYNFKFAIADAQDGILDTGVFLEGGSFQAVPVDLSLVTNIDPSLFGDSVIFEGCGTDADFIFTRPSCQSGDSLYVDVAITGTATNGVDYTLIPDSVLFLPDSTQVIIPFSAFQDGFFEGFESVILTVTNVLPSGDTIVTVGTIWLFDQPNVSIMAQDTAIFCLQDSIDVFSVGMNGVVPYTYQWNTSPNDTNSTLTVPANVNGSIDYYVTITDFCGFTNEDTLTVIVNQTLSIDSVTSMPTGFIQMPNCRPTGVVQAFVSGQTQVLGLANYNWTGPDTIPGPYDVNGTAMDSLPSGWYYFTVSDDVCTLNDSVFVDTLAAPMAGLTANVTAGCTPLSVTFSNTSLNTFTYFWDFGNTNTLSNSNESSQSQVYSNSTQVMLIAYDANLCSDTTFLNIDIILCGCMDPEALNYDPMAVQDDESCVFPAPEAVAPNIFTPNNDGDNDVFFIQTKFSVSIEVTILNRWGNAMYEKTIDLVTNPNTQDGWNGLTPGGTEANEGTYFYKYKATGIKGDTIEGHGFLQLVRD